MIGRVIVLMLQFFGFVYFCFFLEFCIVWCMWESDYVMDIVYVGDELYYVFEVQFKVGVRCIVEFVQFEVLLEFFFVYVYISYMCFQYIELFFLL